MTSVTITLTEMEAVLLRRLLSEELRRRRSAMVGDSWPGSRKRAEAEAEWVSSIHGKVGDLGNWT